MGANANVLEGRAPSKPARYLRNHRFKITFWTAAIEGLLVFVGVIPHLAMYVLAVAAIAFWGLMARNYKSATARNLSWIFAASQALAVLIPVFLFVAKWLAIGAIAIVAVVALVVLFADRSHA
jgi:hypothetical protein